MSPMVDECPLQIAINRYLTAFSDILFYLSASCTCIVETKLQLLGNFLSPDSMRNLVTSHECDDPLIRLTPQHLSSAVIYSETRLFCLVLDMDDASKVTGARKLLWSLPPQLPPQLIKY